MRTRGWIALVVVVLACGSYAGSARARDTDPCSQSLPCFALLDVPGHPESDSTAEVELWDGGKSAGANQRLDHLPQKIDLQAIGYSACRDSLCPGGDRTLPPATMGFQIRRPGQPWINLGPPIEGHRAGDFEFRPRVAGTFQIRAYLNASTGGGAVSSTLVLVLKVQFPTGEDIKSADRAELELGAAWAKSKMLNTESRV
jgi:hypothetical protein